MNDRWPFIAALLIGIAFAILALVGGLILMFAMVFAAILTWLNFGRLAFAGFAIGLGATWAIEFLLAAWNCAGPDLPCGATPIDLLPHIVVSLGIAFVGVAAALNSCRSVRA